MKNANICEAHDEPMVFCDIRCENVCPECDREELEVLVAAADREAAEDARWANGGQAAWEAEREAARLARPQVAGGFPF